MANRNCPNCGAPYEINLNKCPYCGTSYYDLSALDLSAREPFYLKIKTILNGAPCYITQLVRPSAEWSIELSSKITEARSVLGDVVYSCCTGHNLTTNIAFQAVALPQYKQLCTIEMGD